MHSLPYILDKLIKIFKSRASSQVAVRGEATFIIAVIDHSEPGAGGNESFETNFSPGATS